MANRSYPEAYLRHMPDVLATDEGPLMEELSVRSKIRKMSPAQVTTLQNLLQELAKLLLHSPEQTLPIPQLGNQLAHELDKWLIGHDICLLALLRLHCADFDVRQTCMTYSVTYLHECVMREHNIPQGVTYHVLTAFEGEEFRFQ
eukprot:TRINITY_DN28569_c0_g1_i3.p1 TRINITY_DN28569_c0_g1~~TRINITY_DN28569_c0_g1_i3.p1  ORF type:complete len:145 (-),score=13.10 TRINITY_DN28569_c0_g1_i3:184-618(-)